MRKTALTVAELTLFGMLAALTFALKVVMSGLPNIEPVSLMVMVVASVYGLRSLFPIYTYVLLEILVYGIGTWNINYLYVWPILAILAICFRKMEHPLGWAILSGAFGLAFGALCAPVDLFMGGWEFALSKWVSGIGFDLAHCAGNFVIALLLFKPLKKLMVKLRGNLRRADT